LKKQIASFIDSYNKNGSRKWRLTLLTVIIVTLGTFLPPLIDLWVFGAEIPLSIISGSEFVSLLTLVISAYFGANVWQKKIEATTIETKEE
jgi:O-antigen/teichoic acid export membrane protein